MINDGDDYRIARKRIWVAGHSGMVGRALVARLRSESCEIMTATSTELDLRNQRATEEFLADTRPHAVICCAARVGGILANNTRPAEFAYDNLAIALNVINGAYKVSVEKLVMLGSSCIYPRLAPQPMQESDLLSGPLEPTNQWYAVAKIAALKLCEAYQRQYGCNFISCMPSNLYGPWDNFDSETSHVLAALLRKFHEAKVEHRDEVEIWGTGKPLREFLHVDDCVDAILLLLNKYRGQSHINIGSGQDLSIADLANLVAKVVGHSCTLRFDTSKPDGMPRKLLDVSKIKTMGWRPRINLEMGIAATYRWYLDYLGREVNTSVQAGLNFEPGSMVKR